MQMISTTTENPSDHTIHCHGAASILSNSLTPFSKSPTVDFLQGSNVPASEKIQGYFLVWPHDLAPFQPDKDFPAPCLDALLCRVSPIFREGSDIFASHDAPPARLRQLREYAWCLEQEMAQWPGTQPKEWRPKTLGYLPPTTDGKGILEGTTCSPTRIDKYYDGNNLSPPIITPFHWPVTLTFHKAYVSGVWNSYRKPSIHFTREYVVDGHIMVWAGALVNTNGIQGLLDQGNEIFRCSASAKRNGGSATMLNTEK
ncbi:hypothetical protein AA313_de0200480 [Arthrobotrys entomopaga]|nr:hypothetical protein AA313_de0200480 [Arthrobotrys entomopaga]